MINKSILFCFCLFLVFSSCKSGKKAYEKGNYLEAVEQSINRLRKSPGNTKAQETLQLAYPSLVNYNLDRINLLKRGGDAIRWEKIMDYYGQLNKVYDDILRSPAANQVIINPQTFISEFESSRLKAAEARYVLGDQALKRARDGDREAAKQAAIDFDRAGQLVEGFRDSEIKREEAHELALVNVLILPIPIHSRDLNISNEFFYNQVMEYARNKSVNPFVQFYTEKELERSGKQAHHVVRLLFDNFVVGQAAIKETIEERTRDSVVVGTVEVTENDKKVEKDVYGSVKAKVHVFEKRIESGGLLDLQILDRRTDAIISQKKFPGTHFWFDYWGYFNGDERALTEEDEKKLKYSKEVMPPPPQDLFVEFTRPIYDQLTRFIKNYYRNY